MHGSTASGSEASERIMVDASKTSNMQSYIEHARLFVNNVCGLEAAPLPLRQTAWSASKGPWSNGRTAPSHGAGGGPIPPSSKDPGSKSLFSFSGVFVSSLTWIGLHCRPVGGGLGRLQGSIPSSDFKPTDSIFTQHPFLCFFHIIRKSEGPPLSQRCGGAFLSH